MGLSVSSPDEAFAGPSGFQGSAQGGIEGIDESSQNERLGGPRGSRAASGGAIRVRPLLSSHFGHLGWTWLVYTAIVVETLCYNVQPRQL